MSIVRDAAAQTIDGDEDRGPFKHLHQPVEQPFVVVMSWLKIFFKNVLGCTDGLNGQFLIAHLLGAPCNLTAYPIRSWQSCSAIGTGAAKPAKSVRMGGGLESRGSRSAPRRNG
jgi:hypothetical protein